MKFDPKEKKSIGALRTLKILETTFINLLSKKSFDEIQIQEICKESLIPRATFYNYFDDKYDFLNWLLLSFSERIYPEIDESLDHSKNIDIIINNVLDLVDNNIEMFNKIIKKNPINSYFYHEMRHHISNMVRRILMSCTGEEKTNLPLKLIAKWNAEAFLTVFEYVYIEKNECRREEFIEYYKTIQGSK